MKSEWTDRQQEFYERWSLIKAQHCVSSHIPCAEWPEDNSEVLNVVDESRRQYYRDLNDCYFTKPSIVLEIGAETRFSWSASIEQRKHVVLRTSWSYRKMDTSIWQIPVQELLDILSSPEHSFLALQMTHIIMENTLDCLQEEVVKRLFSFVEQHNIVMVVLKYRPFSAPSLADIQSEREFHPHRDAPALVWLAKELITRLYAVQDNRLHLLYLYRPPMGDPIVIPIALENTEKDKRRFYSMMQEKERSNGAIELLIRPLREKRETQSAEMLQNIIEMLLALQYRPQSKKYRVHMMLHPIETQYTLVQLWFIAMAKMASNNRIHMYMDSTCVKGDAIVHTFDGVLINAQRFIAEWEDKGVPKTILQQYAYGQIGDVETIPFAIKRTMPVDVSSCIFQATRIELGKGGL